MSDEEDPDLYQQGVMTDNNSLDPSEFEQLDQQDEHFADDGYGDVDVDFNVVNVRDRRQFTKRCKLLTAIVMLGLAVALAVVFAGTNGGDKTTAGDASSTTSASVALQEPPADLDSTCSIQALADDGTEKCMQHCELAECCDFPANLPLSCLEGNQQKCLTYHAACSHLNADSYDPTTIPSSIPPAPPNLAELCSSASLKTVDGFTGCHEACEHAECCYEENVGTCTHDDCAGYAPCLTLAATDHVHEDIPVLVDQVCADDRLATMEGRAECRHACSHALCCFSANEQQETSCLHQDTTFCNQYAKCNDLESVQPVEATPEEIQLSCQDTEEIPGHISLCELVCEKGACCFSDVGCDPVASVFQCSDFETCRKVFVGDGGGLEDINGDGSGNDESNPPYYMDKYSIDSACETNMVEEVVHVPDQPSLCEEACLPGTCCFDKGTTCNVPDPERLCTIYSSCSRLFPNEDEENENPPVDEEAIKKACHKEDLTECGKLCDPGACCFDGDVCDVPHPERYCAHFGHCDILDEDEDDDLDGDGFDDFVSGEDGNAPVDSKAIKEACENVDLTECERICEPGDCCVDTGGCDVPDPVQFCKNYDPCDALDEENDADADLQDILDGDENVEDESWIDEIGNDGKKQNPPVDPEAIKAACEKDDLTDCQTLCDPGDCCVDGSGCGVPDPATFCENYDPCDVLDDDDGDLQEDGWIDEIGQGGDEDGKNGEPDDLIVEIVDVDGTIVGEDELHAACSGDVVGNNKCETLCRQGACCFDEGCPDVDDEELYCDAFSVCSKFYQDDGNVAESWIDQLDETGDGMGEGDNSGSEPHDMIVEIVDVDGTVVGEDEIRTACMTGSVKCQTLCKQGACCFEGGCTMQNSDRFCVAFGVCSQYYPGE